MRIIRRGELTEHPWKNGGARAEIAKREQQCAGGNLDCHDPASAQVDVETWHYRNRRNRIQSWLCIIETAP